MNSMWKKTINVLYIIFIIAAVWVMITNTIQAFMCDEMTRTQLFKHTLHSFILDFKRC